MKLTTLIDEHFLKNNPNYQFKNREARLSNLKGRLADHFRFYSGEYLFWIASAIGMGLFAYMVNRDIQINKEYIANQGNISRNSHSSLENPYMK